MIRNTARAIIYGALPFNLMTQWPSLWSGNAFWWACSWAIIVASGFLVGFQMRSDASALSSWLDARIARDFEG